MASGVAGVVIRNGVDASGLAITVTVCVTPVAPVNVRVMGTGPHDGACTLPVTVATR